DPFYGSQSAMLAPPTNIQRAVHYYPTNSDFSYLWLNADQSVNFTLNSPGSAVASSSPPYSNIPLSNLTLEKSLVDETSGELVGDPYWQLGVKYPQAGLYELTLSTESPGFYNFEL